MVLPISDDDGDVWRFPLISWLLIIANCVLFLCEIAPGHSFETFILKYAVVPAQLTGAAPADWGLLEPVTLLTSMFIHAGWLHLLGNMAFLRVFSDNVENRFGSLPYLAFYLLCGLIGTLLYVLFNAKSLSPLLGASGAISGVMVSYLLLRPGNNIKVFFQYQLVDVQAGWVVCGWIFFQLVMAGVAWMVNTGTEVAYLGHFGGFLGGLVLTPLFCQWFPEEPDPLFDDDPQGAPDQKLR